LREGLDLCQISEFTLTDGKVLTHVRSCNPLPNESPQPIDELLRELPLVTTLGMPHRSCRLIASLRAFVCLPCRISHNLVGFSIRTLYDEEFRVRHVERLALSTPSDVFFASAQVRAKVLELWIVWRAPAVVVYFAELVKVALGGN